MLLKRDFPAFHQNYHEIRAATNAELGARMGELFGAISKAYIAEAREDPGWRRTVAAAQPMFAMTAQYFPHLAIEFEAYATAAGVSLAELWALTCEAEASPGRSEKCTTVVTNAGFLVAHNEDWDEDSDDSICIVKKTLGNTTSLDLHYYDAPLGGNAICMNSHGYVQAINSVNHTDRQVGVPKNVIARWLSETADIEKDFATLQRVPRASGFNHVFVDDDGKVSDVECSAGRQILQQPGLPYVHTNHYLSPELVGLEEADVQEGTFERYNRACLLARPRMSIEEIERLTADRDSGRERSILNPRTIGRVIVDIRSRVAKIWLKRERAAGWIDYALN